MTEPVQTTGGPLADDDRPRIDGGPCAYVEIYLPKVAKRCALDAGHSGDHDLVRVT